VYGEGSNYQFSLKQSATTSDISFDNNDSNAAIPSESSNTRENFTAPKARILVVDDNNMNLVVFKSLIKKTLIVPDTADSGDEALERMREKKYDLIFLDHMMPEKDGIMTLQEMKADKDNPNHDTPAVCLTANAVAGAKEQYLSAGFDDYLTKPISPDRLEDMLLKYLPKDLIVIVHEDPNERNKASSGTVQIPDELIPLLNQDLIDVKYGLQKSGLSDAYLTVLKVIYDSIESKTEELNRYYSDKDYKNYTIKVHALKSSARIIGAMGLGDEAQLLEDAGNAEDADYIGSHHDEFIRKYCQLQELIAPVFAAEKEEEQDKPVADSWLMSEAYNQIKAAAEDMDCDILESVFDEMSDYAVPADEAELWQQIKKASDSFEYETIISLLESKV
jgi:CheY-like chemotaxis protein